MFRIHQEGIHAQHTPNKGLSVTFCSGAKALTLGGYIHTGQQMQTTCFPKKELLWTLSKHEKSVMWMGPPTSGYAGTYHKKTDEAAQQQGIALPWSGNQAGGMADAVSQAQYQPPKIALQSAYTGSAWGVSGGLACYGAFLRLGLHAPKIKATVLAVIGAAYAGAYQASILNGANFERTRLLKIIDWGEKLAGQQPGYFAKMDLASLRIRAMAVDSYASKQAFAYLAESFASQAKHDPVLASLLQPFPTPGKQAPYGPLAIDAAEKKATKP